MFESGFAKQNQDKLKDGWDIIQLVVDRIRSLVLEILYIAKERDLKWEHVEINQFTQDVVKTCLILCKNILKIREAFGVLSEKTYLRVNHLFYWIILS